MPFLLAALKTGLRDPTLEMFYPVFVACCSLLFLSLVWWAARRLAERRKVRRSSWNTFNSIAKVRKLTPLETRTLATLIGKAKVKRPTQVLGSTQLFDRCVEQVIAKGGLTENQQAILEVVRRKLVATAAKWDGANRRNLERLKCQLAVQVSFVTREAVEDELKGSVVEGDPRYLETLNSLLATAPTVKGELTTVSAGGVSLLTLRLAQVREGDYAVIHGEPARVGVDLNNLLSQIVFCEDHSTPGKCLFHLGFLPYPVERRRDIIRFVYKTPAPAAGAAPAVPTPPAPLPGSAAGTSEPVASP